MSKRRKTARPTRSRPKSSKPSEGAASTLALVTAAMGLATEALKLVNETRYPTPPPPPPETRPKDDPSVTKRFDLDKLFAGSRVALARQTGKSIPELLAAKLSFTSYPMPTTPAPELRFSPAGFFTLRRCTCDGEKNVELRRCPRCGGQLSSLIDGVRFDLS